MGKILQGRDACDWMLNDQVTFLNRLDVSGNVDGSPLLHVAAIAYDRHTGKALPFAGRPEAGVQGTPWREETVEEDYPCIASAIAGLAKRQ